MKKNSTLLTMIFLMIFNAISFAQSIEVKSGLNLSTMLYKNVGGTYSDDFQLAPRFLIGITSEFSISESVSFESGLLFSSKGYKIDIKDFAVWQTGEHIDLYENAILHYIDIPISIRYHMNVNKIQIFGVLGPYIGIGINGNVYNKEYTDNQSGGVDYIGIIKHKGKMGDNELWKRLDYGIQAGAGMIVKKMVLRINYSYGLADIAQNTGTKNKNRVLGLSFGYIVNK